MSGSGASTPAPAAAAQVANPNIDTQVDVAIAEQLLKDHELDNLNLFIYMMLLILTILTAWFFKHVRNRYIHETGLAVVYGLIIGLIMRETAPPPSQVAITCDKPTFGITPINGEPYLTQHIYFRRCSNESSQTDCSSAKSTVRTYEYTFVGAVSSKEGANSGGGSKLPDRQTGLAARATFDAEVFFNIILPAIIFHAGYSLKRRHFFVNIGAILVYAFIGTAISTFAIAGVVYVFCLLPTFSYLKFSFTDAMFFGSIISATDPVSILAIFSDLGVDVDLHALILGESVLNDAVAIVLSGAVLGYVQASISSVDGSGTAEIFAVLKAFGNFFVVFLGAFAIGTATALSTALITKFTKIREFPLFESALFLLMSYSTFLAAEAASLTGIVALLFCGIFQAHYTYYNLSSESRNSLRQITELISFLAENFCFVQIGVTIFTFSNHIWDIWFILASLFAIAIGRFCNVYPLSFLINRISACRKGRGLASKRPAVPAAFQHMMMFAGLRGAMAFALAIRDVSSPQRQVVFSTTLVIVVVTIIVCGALVAPMLQTLRIKVGVSQDEHEHHYSEPVLQIERIDTDDYQIKSTIAPLGSDAQGEEQNQSAASSNIEEMTVVEDIDVPDTIVTVNDDASARQHRRYSSAVIRRWKNVDSRILKPIFTHCRPLLSETFPRYIVFQWLARILTTTQQYDSGGIIDDIPPRRPSLVATSSADAAIRRFDPMISPSSPPSKSMNAVADIDVATDHHFNS